MRLPESIPAGISRLQMDDYNKSDSSMGVEGEGFSGSHTLSPLPPTLRVGLPVVTVFGFLSFDLSLSLFVYLLWKIRQWRRRSKGSHTINQFTILILNLLFADIQQSLAFLLNFQWVLMDKISIKKPTCYIQGWFLSTGDLASGVWCLAIGIHTFASVLFNRRLSTWGFYVAIISLWLFVYACAMISIAIHPDLYVRAGAWCWVNEKYSNVRLYLHYLWIFVAELGVVTIYLTMFLVLLVRIRNGFYAEKVAQRAKSVAMLMAVYPTVYVICTLPLAAARTATMAGRNVSLGHLVVAGAMITSNGWLDVALYALTRRILIFSDDPPPEDCGIATFILPWECKSRFGTFTSITSDCEKGSKAGSLFRSFSKMSKHSTKDSKESISLSDIRVEVIEEEAEAPESSTSNGAPSQSVANFSRRVLKEKWTCQFAACPRRALRRGNSVRKETTIHVTSAPMDAEDLKEMQEAEQREDNVAHNPLAEDSMNLDFQTRPEGL